MEAKGRMRHDPLHNATPECPPVFEQADKLYTHGDLDQALALYREVNQKQPDLSEPWSRMGLIHLQRSQWDSAVTCYREALLRNENQAADWYNLAQGLEESGNPDEAAAAYAKAVEIDPGYWQALYNLGRLYLLQGNFEQAGTLYRQCIRLVPGHASVHNNLGKALAGMNRHREAVVCFERACELDPTLGEAWFNLAEILGRGKERKRAISYYQKAIEVQSDPSAACNNLGTLCEKLGDYQKAAGWYMKVLERNPDLAQAHYNLGSVLRLMESYEPALKHLTHAVRLKPDYAEAWNNLALACKNIGALDRALLCFNKAVEYQPDLAVAHWNRSFIHLLKEDYITGWNDFEWRFRLPNWKTIYPLRPITPCWDGSSCARHTILVHDEQGLGDTLQFVRYLPMVRSRCSRTVLETRPELVSLLQNAPGIDQIVERPKNETEQAPCDYHVPLMSLPGIFRTTVETIPADVPYLYADAVKCSKWAPLLSGPGLRIGLSWAGRPQHTNDHNRSCPLSAFLPLLAVPGTRFVSLQKGEAAGQLQQLSHPYEIDDLGGRLYDLSDTAAVMANLDLVITVDTAVAHLAGAMGIPVWVMIPFIADWRWGASGQTSSWYPSLRLFRQPRPKDWSAVLDAIRQELLSLLSVTVHSLQKSHIRPNLSAITMKE